MTALLIKGGRLLDPGKGLDEVGDLLIVDDRIEGVGKVDAPADATVIDATGLVVVPGLIDMHVHLREPGNDEEETIDSGAKAAAFGGVTTVIAMPNTDPPIDTEAAAEFYRLQGKRSGMANVYPVGCITKERKGESLAEMGGLDRGGAIAFSDDGDSVRNTDVLRRGLMYAKMFDKPILEHCEDPHLAIGVMNAGPVAVRLGLSGNPAAAEEIMVSRDLSLAEITGGRLHIQHVSTGRAVDLIRRAKAEGVDVTCEATPHHFTLTHDEVESFNPVFKMRPPLRSAGDVAAVREGLKDGAIDVIASDHAPHSNEEKDLEFSLAPDGVIGVETMLSVTLTELVHTGVLTLGQAIEKMTAKPAKILGLEDKGTFSAGKDADVTIIDLEKSWTVDRLKLHSKSHNCPFHGREMKGKAVITVVRGRVVVNER
ncbi:MAG: dihydroorotase [Planctomycetota bacterium]|nr:MAG: dihydroorotase [Planctomycetota bacterium]